LRRDNFGRLALLRDLRLEGLDVGLNLLIAGRVHYLDTQRYVVDLGLLDWRSPRLLVLRHGDILHGPFIQFHSHQLLPLLGNVLTLIDDVFPLPSWRCPILEVLQPHLVEIHLLPVGVGRHLGCLLLSRKRRRSVVDSNFVLVRRVPHAEIFGVVHVAPVHVRKRSERLDKRLVLRLLQVHFDLGHHLLGVCGNSRVVPSRCLLVGVWRLELACALIVIGFGRRWHRGVGEVGCVAIEVWVRSSGLV